MADSVIGFADGYRKDAIKKAIEMVKKEGRSAVLVVCRDIPGDHDGGEGCFCDPKKIIIHPEDLE